MVQVQIKWGKLLKINGLLASPFALSNSLCSLCNIQDFAILSNNLIEDIQSGLLFNLAVTNVGSKLMYITVTV
jgi:hypothetical protein